MNQKVLLIVLCVLAGCATIAISDAVVNSGGDVQAVRSDFRIPELFNFEQFKAMFNKHYKSLREEIMRHGLFLARAFRAFVSMVKFRHFQADYYLKVTSKSDETLEERMSMFMHLDGREQPAEADKPVEEKRMEPEELREKLAEIEARKAEPEFKPLADELHELQKEGDKSVVAPTNNEDEDEEIQEVSARHKNPLQGLAENLMKNPLAKQLMKNPVAQNVGNMMQEHVIRHLPKKPLPDQVFVDLRDTGCLLPVEIQGYCGSCYSFSTLAMFEYLFCRATGHQVYFSKQYMISCGDWTYMGKCMGAYLGSAVRFVNRYGLELARDWPYLEKDGTCPHEPGSKGSLRLQRPTVGLVEFKDFDEYLKERPILFSLDLPEEVADYGGGVFAPESGCMKGMLHAMLIVGHGRQDGKEYYLFRNSWSDEFGEDGYLKFSKDLMSKCSTMLYGISSLGEFSPDAFDQLKADRPFLRSVKVPEEERGAPLKVDSKSARLLREMHPDFVEYKKHDPFLHLYPESTLKQVVPHPDD